MKKEFIVVSISTNTNSFGLRGMVICARDGEAYEIGINYLKTWQRGNVIQVDPNNLAEIGEIPRKMQKPSRAVCKEIWTVCSQSKPTA